MSCRVVAAGRLGPTFERVRAIVDMGAPNAPTSPRLAWPAACHKRPSGGVWLIDQQVAPTAIPETWIAYYFAHRFTDWQ